MSGTTPVLALPYATGADKVITGDNAIKALADALEALLAPTSSGVTAAANYNSASVTVDRSGKVAICNVNGASTGALASGATLFTLPPGYRPKRLMFADLVNASAGTTVRVHADTTGIVTTQAAINAVELLRGSFPLPL